MVHREAGWYRGVAFTSSLFGRSFLFLSMRKEVLVSMRLQKTSNYINSKLIIPIFAGLSRAVLFTDPGGCRRVHPDDVRLFLDRPALLIP